eukprot:4360497-Prymnesium_polylepis.1
MSCWSSTRSTWLAAGHSRGDATAAAAAGAAVGRQTVHHHGGGQAARPGTRAAWVASRGMELLLKEAPVVVESLLLSLQLLHERLPLLMLEYEGDEGASKGVAEGDAQNVAQKYERRPRWVHRYQQDNHAPE